MKLIIELLVIGYLISGCLLAYAYIMTYDDRQKASDFQVWVVITKTILVGLFWPLTWPIVWWYRK